MPHVTLAPLNQGILAALRQVRVAEDQVQFSRQPADVLDAPQDGATPIAILRDGTPVGMLRIDTAYAQNHDFAEPGALGLRSFIVGRDAQGQGIGTAATRVLPAFLAQHYPHATAIYLTVNLRNPQARRAYLKGGFTDTGAHYLGGDAGPQHIMHMTLDRHGATVENLAPSQVTG